MLGQIKKFAIDLALYPYRVVRDLVESFIPGKSLAEDPNSQWYMDVELWRQANHIKDAPPWRVFPKVKNAFPAVNQGENEFYMNYWAEWFNPLSAAEKDQYLRDYGAPPEWFQWLSSQGSWNRHLPQPVNE